MTVEEWLGDFIEANQLDWEKLTKGERFQVTRMIPCNVRCFRVGGPVSVDPGQECPECGKERPLLTNWASNAIVDLRAGRTTQIRPSGQSMHGRVESGALVTLTPIESHEDIRVDDVVLVRVQGRVYLHLVKARDGDRLQIGNNRGGING
jgi:hypothetical protein